MRLRGTQQPLLSSLHRRTGSSEVPHAPVDCAHVRVGMLSCGGMGSGCDSVPQVVVALWRCDSRGACGRLAHSGQENRLRAHRADHGQKDQEGQQCRQPHACACACPPPPCASSPRPSLAGHTWASRMSDGRPSRQRRQPPERERGGCMISPGRARRHPPLPDLGLAPAGSAGVAHLFTSVACAGVGVGG